MISLLLLMDVDSDGGFLDFNKLDSELINSGIYARSDCIEGTRLINCFEASLVILVKPH